MDKIDVGGPAFPIAFQHNHPDGSTRTQEWAGMTLRDYFAGLVIGPIMLDKPSQIGIQDGAETAAMIAYMIADAMLRARAK